MASYHVACVEAGYAVVAHLSVVAAVAESVDKHVRVVGFVCIEECVVLHESAVTGWQRNLSHHIVYVHYGAVYHKYLLCACQHVVKQGLGVRAHGRQIVRRLWFYSRSLALRALCLTCLCVQSRCGYGERQEYD